MWRWITDWIWPTLAPHSPGYLTSLEAELVQTTAAHDTACVKDREGSRSWLSHELDDFKDEQARAERTRTTLRSMFAAAAIAMTGTIALGGWLLSRLGDSNGSASRLTEASFAAAMFGGAYIVLQLVAVLHSATRGLQVRAFWTVPHPVRPAGEPDEAFDRRKAAAVRRANAFNAEQTNDAVSWKKAALVAWRNLAAGLVVVLAGLLAAVLVSSYG